MNDSSLTSEITQRLIHLLQKIQSEVLKTGRSLNNILSQAEGGNGLVPYDTFVTLMRNQYFTNVQDEDLRFLAENYLISS